MQFSTLAIAAALSIGSAFAQGNVKVHVVTVGMSGNTFTPNNLTAAVGEMVQFQFTSGSHSVVQSSFDGPCQPISSTVGVFSGFMPVEASAANIPTFTILINDTNTMWLYCSRAKHCQDGMTMVINENTAKNATRSLANYNLMAKSVPSSGTPGGGETNGTDGSVAASGAGASPTGASTSSASTPKPTSGAMAIRAPEALGFTCLLAGAIALLL